MYAINVENVLLSSNFAAVTKRSVQIIRNHSLEYLTPGDFFKLISDDEIKQLIELVEGTHAEDPFSIQNLLVISHLLSQAEGIHADGDAEITRCLNYFMSMIFFVSLHRKGLVTLNYKKLTFGEELNDADVVKLRDGVSREDFLSDEDDQ